MTFAGHLFFGISVAPRAGSSVMNKTSTSKKDLHPACRPSMLVASWTDDQFLRLGRFVAEHVALISGSGQQAVGCTPGSSSTVRPQFLFRRSGFVREISFEGVEVHPPPRDSLGFKLIEPLLREPRRSIPAGQLRVEAGVGSQIPEQAREPMIDYEDSDVPNGSLISARNDSDAIYDTRARQEMQAELRRLSRQRAEAHDLGDAVALERIEGELEQLQPYLAQLNASSGRGRSFSNPRERARQSVEVAVRRARHVLRPLCPALEQHIHDFLHPGHLCIYEPPGPMHWVT